MAVFVVAFDGTRLDTADALGTVWTDTGGKAANAEPDFIYQRTSGTDGSVSEKVGTSPLGVAYNDATGVDMSTTPRVVTFKVIATNSSVLNNEGPNGGIIEVGSGGVRSAYYEYYVVGGDTYPPSQNWLFPFINPNVTAWYDVTNGSPSLTAVDWLAWSCDFTAASKSENVAMDAVGHVAAGKGLTYTLGDTGVVGDYSSFVAKDEGLLTNRWGIVSTRSEVIFCHLTLTVGSSSACKFDSSNEQIVFPFMRVDEGDQGLAFDLSHASTIVSLTNDVFKSVGRDNEKQYFDTDHQVTASDDIALRAPSGGHGFETGDAVLYSKEGGSEAIGLTDATEYFIEVAGVWQTWLHTTRQGAITSGTPVALTPSTSGNGEDHSLRRQPMTTFHFTVTGTSGDMAVTGCNFVRPGTVTSTDAVTWVGCSFVEPWSIVVVGASFTGCSFLGAMTVPGEYLITGTVAQLELITYSDFEAATRVGLGGHAYYVTGTASDLDLVGIGFDGYGNDPGEGNGMAFDTETDIDGTNDEIDYVAHGWATADVVYYSKYDPTDGTAGTETPGLTDGEKYYVRAVSADVISLHLTWFGATWDVDQIVLTASTAGNGETHTLYSGDAAIVNATGGDIDVNVTEGGGTPSIRNVAGATTTVVVNPVTLTINTVDASGGADIQNARVVVISNTGGDMKAEAAITSITRVTTTATVTTTAAHGLSTGDEVLILDTAPTGALNDEAGYTGIKAITVTGASTFTFTCLGTETATATRSYEFWEVIISNDLTNASGIVLDTRTYSADQPILVSAFKGTSAPTYKAVEGLSAEVSSTANTTVTVPMTAD